MIRVAAGILRDPRGRILVSQRPAGKHLAGTWEFPGGKCEPHEAPGEALVRELAEELGIRVQAADPLLSLTHDYPESRVRLLLLEVSAYAGEPRGLEGQPLKWVCADELDELEMPAADRPIVKALRLDPRYAITPDPETVGGADALLDWIERCLDQGFGLIQLRAHQLDSEVLRQLADRLGSLVGRFNARWVLNGSPRIAMATGADGIHLSSKRLLSLDRRPLPDDRLVMASCHDRRELAHAGRIGADFVTLSPVNPTASHPEADVLGWSGFADLCPSSPLPVFALGGVGPDDLVRARQYGAFGVAGIRAFGAT